MVCQRGSDGRGKELITKPDVIQVIFKAGRVVAGYVARAP